MSDNSIKNMSASVHARLLDQATKDGRPFNELLQYFAMERFLYRLSKSKHTKLFVLKGAMMLRVWKTSEIRPTMDIDLLGKTDNEIESMVSKIKDVTAVGVESDGLTFSFDSVVGESIVEDAAYEGVRVNFEGYLGNAKINMQIDIGFGDIIYPSPKNEELPGLLDFPRATVLCYSRESAIAEKFQAMVKLGELNSRMKDFFDIWHLSRQFDFNGEHLAEAIRLTFQYRKTEIPRTVTAFTKGFVDLKKVQWAAFHKRLKKAHAPESFAEIVAGMDSFITPINQALFTQGKIPATWVAPGPWN